MENETRRETRVVVEDTLVKGGGSWKGAERRRTPETYGKGESHVPLARREFCGETFMWIGHNRTEE